MVQYRETLWAISWCIFIFLYFILLRILEGCVDGIRHGTSGSKVKFKRVRLFSGDIKIYKKWFLLVIHWTQFQGVLRGHYWKLNSPFQRKSVTLLCRRFGRNEMYFMCPVAQSCPALCDPMDYRPPGLSVYGIFQAKILEWVAIACSRGSSRARDWTCVSFVSFIDRQILYLCAT